MESQPVDPRWPKLMSLAVHEFRTPLTVVAGYIRMLLKDRGGPLNEQQRRLLEEAEKSCGRLSVLLAEMSEVGALEKGAATFNRSPIDLRTLIRDAAAALPEIPDRDVPIEVVTDDGAAMLQGDPVRLKTAFTSLFHALRREVVASPRLLIRESVRRTSASGQSWIAIGDDEHIAALTAATPATLVTFDEWRGGCGLSLAIARRVINAHGGSLWGPSGEAKAAAVVAIPLSS
jgi:signal transduction histidine kinase